MLGFVVERARVDQSESLCSLLRLAVAETCRRNHIDDEAIRDSEMDDKVQGCLLTIESKAPDRYLASATLGNQVVAVGRFYPCSQDIVSHCLGATASDYEVGSLYVHPDFQGQGLGRSMFRHLKDQLKQRGVRRAFLDSGYPTSQAYWRKELGDPAVVAPSLFGPRFTYRIWEFDVSAIR